jgi:type 1 fimbriae regulatory protein FimB/type 1 fimbriae regulatory protein FimE
MLLIYGTLLDIDTMKTWQKTRIRRTGSTTVNGTVPPRLTLNRDRRPREHLTPKEVERLMVHARKRGRYGVRNATMILIAYRHGLRPGELCTLRWDQIDFARGLLHVLRLKNGIDSVHPLGGTEVRGGRRAAIVMPKLKARTEGRARRVLRFRVL